MEYTTKQAESILVAAAMCRQLHVISVTMIEALVQEFNVVFKFDLAKQVELEGLLFERYIPTWDEE